MLPHEIATESELEEELSVPSPDLVDLMREIDGELMILGIGGKIGPSLGRTAARAVAASGRSRRIYGVSRFTDSSVRDSLDRVGIETIVCDLLDVSSVERLPKARNIIFMAGRKFGTTGAEGLTWAMNVLVPGNVARCFSESRIVVFSTGCVYPLVDSGHAGSREVDPAEPLGEYANSCLGRERVFEHYSAELGSQVCILRLNYAIDLRYGVLFDIASRVFNGETVSLSVPYVNVIWQGDVNNQALSALPLCASPPEVLNITGAERLSVRRLAGRFGELFDKPVHFENEDATGSLLSDSSRARELFGSPRVPIDTMVEWTAAWIRHGGRSLGKPTHFEASDGRY